MNGKKGFSLLELLIVIGIIAVLGGVMLTQFSGSTESALSTACMNNLRTLCNAVMADASKESYYPAAGPYQYIDLESGGDKVWYQGWIGHAKGEQTVSCYHTPGDAAESQHHAITNGTIWRSINGQRSAYVCPAHTKYCKSKKKPTPAWTYAMNSFFGWNDRVAADAEMGRRQFGSGSFTFQYTSAPKSRSRPIEKVLLFAEIPFVDTGIQTPSWETGAGKANDMILQYSAGSDENKKSNHPSDGSGEIIGFNHKAGKSYSANVAFADGHCAKLMLPDDANEANLKELTTWLCTGLEYTFNGSKYVKVSE